MIQTGDDFFGSVVNKSARIAASAAPGEIWLSDATRLMAGDGVFAQSGPRDLALKGLPGRHVVYSLNWRENVA